MPQQDSLTQLMISLALAAGEKIMAIYAGDFDSRIKSDLSPVTEADVEAETLILKGLSEVVGHIPVVSEEAASNGHFPLVTGTFFLVDPLDGTKEFISRNGEFTVNIALIENFQPLSGVVYAPAQNRLFAGRVGVGAVEGNVIGGQVENWRCLRVRECPAEGLTVVASRSHRDTETEKFLQNLPVAQLVTAGSSLKFCLVAAGEADLYPRFGRTMEWDTAAGDAVLRAAGGWMSQTDGSTFLYGKQDRGYDNPGFIASGQKFAKH